MTHQFKEDDKVKTRVGEGQIVTTGTVKYVLEQPGWPAQPFIVVYVETLERYVSRYGYEVAPIETEDVKVPYQGVHI